MTRSTISFVSSRSQPAKIRRCGSSPIRRSNDQERSDSVCLKQDVALLKRIVGSVKQALCTSAAIFAPPARAECSPSMSEEDADDEVFLEVDASVAEGFMKALGCSTINAEAPTAAPAKVAAALPQKLDQLSVQHDVELVSVMKLDMVPAVAVPAKHISLKAIDETEASHDGLRIEMSRMQLDLAAECPSRAGPGWCEETTTHAILGEDGIARGYLVLGKTAAHGVRASEPELTPELKRLAMRAPPAIVVLQQVWVDPTHRRTGAARAAIAAALASVSSSSSAHLQHLLVEAPTAQMCTLLEELGWTLVGSRWAAGRSFLCRYVRA